MSVFDPSDIVAAAREAGDYALARWRRGEKPDAKTWEKSPGHPVCDIDIAVDELLKERLEGKVDVDFATARRLFTLICVLHIRG